MVRAPLDLSLYLVTDTLLCGSPEAVVDTVTEAVSSGVTVVQLRDPTATDEELVALGRRTKAALRGSDVPLLLNDRVHLVEVIGADGAHVGQGDIGPVQARNILGPERYLGLSVQCPEHVDAAAGMPPGTVDYLGVGPVWPQATKPDAAPASSPEVLAEVVRRSPWPCVAIGGVDSSRAAQVKAAGAAGLAVVSAVCGRPDVAGAVRSLRDAWQQA